MNIHTVVRGAISNINADESVMLYQSLGQVNEAGKIFAKYAEGLALKAQVQSVSDAALNHADRVGQNDIVRHFYLHAVKSLPPAGIVRTAGRNGDIIQRDDGTFWLVEAVVDDFSSQNGWVCVRGILQIKPPDFSRSDWFTGGDNG